MQSLQLTPKLLILLDEKDRQSTKVEFWYTHGGSWYEQGSDHGRRHLLEHALVSRTKELDDNQFKEYCFEQNFRTNAYTSAGVINLNGSSHKNDALKLVELFAELYFKPTFSEATLVKEREIVLREIADRQGDPEYQLWQDIGAKIYTEGSLDRHETLGTSEEVGATTLEDFERIYHQILNDSTLVISVAGGGITMGQIKQIITPYTTTLLTDSKPLPHDYTTTLSVKNFQTFYHPLAHQAAAVNLILPFVVDFQSRATRSVFAELFLGYNGSGLYDYLRDELGLIYGYSSSFDLPSQSLQLELNSEIELVPKILEGIHTYFQDFELRFDQKKFEVLKRNTLKKFEQARDSLGFDNNFAIENLLAYNQVESIEEYINKLNMVSELDVQNLYETVYKNWPNTTAIVTSRKQEVTQIQYAFR